MTQLLFTMNVKTVALFFHSIVLIHFGSLEVSANVRPPTIRCQSQNDLIVYSSKYVFIPCEADGETPEKLLNQYWWTKDGSNISLEMTQNNEKNDDNCILGVKIDQPKDTNEGVYQCFVTNKLGTAMSNPVSLRKAAQFQEINGIQNATVGSPFQLSCKVPENAVGLEQNYWAYKKNEGNIRGKTYPIRNPRITYDSKGNLWFSEVQLDDASDSVGYYYYVNQIDGADHLFCKTELRVDQSAPQANDPVLIQQYVSNENELAVYGEKKTLFCIYGGTSDIIWKKDGQLLEFTQEKVDQKYIEITNFKGENEGNYTCEVYKKGGTEIQKTHHFTVKIGKPFFKNGPVKQQISEGHAVEFHCEVNHDSNEKKDTLTQWIYNRKPMNECSFLEDIHFENGFSVLKINKTKKVHIGTYGCNVTNAYGYIYKEGYLYMEEARPPVYNNESAVNVTFQKYEGDALNWTCPVTAYPEPEIKWTKNNEPLSNTVDSRINILNNGKLLTIIDINSNDTGEYFCIAYCSVSEPLSLGFNLTLQVKHHSDLPSPSESDNPTLTILLWLIAILVIAAVILVILIIGKKHGFTHRIYDLRKRENQADNQHDPKTCEQSEVSLLAGGSAHNGTLNLQRRGTENGITLAEVESRA